MDYKVSAEGGCRMAFSPNEATVYGGGTLITAFSQDTVLPIDAKYFVAYEGSTQRHITTARLTNPYTLNSFIPEHNTSEAVCLTVFICHHGNPPQSLMSSTFTYTYDSAYQLAQYLVESVFDPGALENLELVKLDQFDLSNEELSTLDDKLTRAFKHINLSEGWNIMGLDSTLREHSPRDTLLHFAAKFGLTNLAEFLLTQPGSEIAVRLINRHGKRPIDIAHSLKMDRLTAILTNSHRYGPMTQSWAYEQRQAKKSPPRVLQRHDHGMVTITNNIAQTSAALEDDIDMLVNMGQQSTSWNQVNKSPSDGGTDGPDTDKNEEDNPFTNADPYHYEQVRHQRHGNHQQKYYQRNKKPRDRGASAPPLTIDTSKELPLGQQSFDIPAICVTPPGTHKKHNVLEENLRRLHEINVGIERLREINAQQEDLDEQDARKENLQKYSKSCPSLAEQEPNRPPTPPPDYDEAHINSILALSNQNGTAMGSNFAHHEDIVNMPNMQASQFGYAQQNLRPMDTDVRIVINDVTVGSSEDYAEYNQDALDPIEFQKMKRRRSSWCPEEGRKEEEKKEKQRMLSVSGRSQSLSSLDGQDDDEDETDDEDDDEADKLSSTSSQDNRGSPVMGTTKKPSGAKDMSKRSSSLTGSEKGLVSVSSTPGERSNKLAISPPQPLSLSVPNTSSAGTTGQTGGFGRYSNGSSPQSDVVDGSLSMSPHHPNANTTTTLTVPHSTLTKSISTPSIPSAKDETSTREERSGSGSFKDRRTGTITEGGPEANHSQLVPSSGEEEKTEDEDEVLDAFHKSSQDRPRMSMIEFFNDHTFEDDTQPKQIKEEKKRRSSVFSKFGSYRNKSKVQSKYKTTHQFVAISVSNESVCDVCSKPMANKAALQCENCMVNVHDNNCKDLIAPCSRLKNTRLTHRVDNSKMARIQYASLPQTESGTVAGVKSSHSFKDNKSNTVPARSFQIPSSSSGQNQTNKVITDDKDKEKEKEKDGPSQETMLSPQVQTQLGQDPSNITDTMSISMESLDEGAPEVNDFEEDPYLMAGEEEPEAWSVTVDKKTLKKMTAKDIKRQDHIWELIQTEKRHCRTLKIMQKIFSRGMREELHLSQDWIDRIFPRLDDMVDIHITFLQSLLDKQKLRPDKNIEDIGDVLVKQYEGEMGSRMKVAYGEFCSRHIEAVQLYKDMLKSDRKFQNFIKKCSRNNLCKRRGIPECILLVTQRMTKYPLLIESIIKATKENKPDRERLKTALHLAKGILSYVDDEIDAHAKEQRLIEIYNKLDARSYCIFRGKKFKKSDLLSSRKLLHEGMIKFMSARGKAFEVQAVILSDLVFFLLDNNQKYTFFSQDNKSSAISLSKLLVREKGDTKDSKGIYLICQSKTDPEMYELVCKSADDRKNWITYFRNAIASCPEEDEGLPSESEGERKLLEARSLKIRQLIDQLHKKDQAIHECCEDKMKVFLEMMELYGRDDIQANLRPIYKGDDGSELMDPEEMLQAALQEASRLGILLQTQGGSINLSRSVSSAGEHESGTFITPPLPKRAETFSGFEGRDKSGPRKASPAPSPRDSDSDSRSNSNQNLHDSDETIMTSSLAVDVSGGKVMNRRMSTSFLQNFLTKQHTDKDDTEKALSEKGSDKSSLGELSNASASSISPLPVVPPSKEHCQALASLIQYLHGLVYVSTQQTTEVESFRVQLAEANSKISRLYSENDKHPHNKNAYHHDKQLEELRNLQEQINTERENWDKTKEKAESQLEAQRDEIRRLREELDKEKNEIKTQKEELEKRKAVLQKQIDLFEQQKLSEKEREKKLSRTSSNVFAANDSPKLQQKKYESPSHKAAPAGSVSQSVWDNVVHKRSASDDIKPMQFDGDVFEPMKEHQSLSLKEPLNRKETKQDTKPRPSSASSAHSGASVNVSRKESMREMPAHLMSATNEQKMGGPIASNQLPIKLASTKSTSSLIQLKNSPNNPSGVSQKLPLKLSNVTSTTSLPTYPGMTSPPGPVISPPGDGSKMTQRHMRMTSPPPGVGVVSRNTSSVTREMRTSTSRMTSVGSMPQGQSVLPMKLAEMGKGRPKSTSVSNPVGRGSPVLSNENAKSIPEAPPRNRSKSTGKKEPEVIYF